MGVWAERSIGSLVAIAAGSILMALHHGSTSSILQTAMLVASALAFVQMRQLRELGVSDHRSHATATAWWHFATTNIAAVAYAWFMFDGYATANVEAGSLDSNFKLFGSAAKDWMLVSGLIGSTIGLFRSTGSNSAALAALRQNAGLLDQVTSLRRMLGDTASLTTMAVDASQARSIEAVTEAVGRMVTTASDLPDKSELVDAFTVWFRDDATSSWRVLAGRGVSTETMTRFQQPILSQPEDGKGIVANLAAAGQPQLILTAGAGSHHWFARDPDSNRVTEGLAAVLLYDKRGMPCGALCLTSQDAGALPSNAEDLQRFERVLQLWAATFSLPVQRYHELIEAE